jgi:D-alanyl-D-alanine carboxypeptidase
MTKTGFTYEAGRCLMTAAKNFDTGTELIGVVLNSKSGYLSSDVYTLLDYYLNQ